MIPNLKSGDVAKRFNVSRPTVSRWMQTGKLRAMKVRAIYRTSEEWLDEFIQQHTTDPAEAVINEVMDTWFPRGG